MLAIKETRPKQTLYVQECTRSREYKLTQSGTRRLELYELRRGERAQGGTKISRVRIEMIK